MKPRHLLFVLPVCLLSGGAIGLGYRYAVRPNIVIPFPSPLRRTHLTRPYGMAPVAFDAFIRACCRAGVSADRLTQTIGEHPLSKGYHKRDGVLRIKGQKIEYCAATDIHVFGLDDAQIARLSDALAQQGFACWYRHGGKWTGGEHIHAVYALLPMKPQLRGQVRQFLAERRAAQAKPLAWEKKLRRKWV
jgi:hypothetical protein